MPERPQPKRKRNPNAQRQRHNQMRQREFQPQEERMADLVRVPQDANHILVEADLHRDDAKEQVKEQRIRVHVFRVAIQDRDRQAPQEREQVAWFEWHNAEPLPDDEPLPSVRLPAELFRGYRLLVKVRSQGKCRCGVNVEFD